MAVLKSNWEWVKLLDEAPYAEYVPRTRYSAAPEGSDETGRVGEIIAQFVLKPDTGRTEQIVSEFGTVTARNGVSKRVLVTFTVIE